MCHSCKNCGTPRNCKTELRRRLVRALEIVDSMEGDVFQLNESRRALELHRLLDNVQRDHVPLTKAFCTVKVYATVGGKTFADPVTWAAFTTEKKAKSETKKTAAYYKLNHEKHPWWGPWETHGDRFVVRLGAATVGQLARSTSRQKNQ